jgi:hypothetical protein
MRERLGFAALYKKKRRIKMIKEILVFFPHSLMKIRVAWLKIFTQKSLKNRLNGNFPLYNKKEKQVFLSP